MDSLGKSSRLDDFDPRVQETPWNPFFLRMLQTTLSHAFGWWIYERWLQMQQHPIWTMRQCIEIAKSKSHPSSCRFCALVYASRISKVVRKVTWNGKWNPWRSVSFPPQFNQIAQPKTTPLDLRQMIYKPSGPAVFPGGWWAWGEGVGREDEGAFTSDLWFRCLLRRIEVVDVAKDVWWKKNAVSLFHFHFLVDFWCARSVKWHRRPTAPGDKISHLSTISPWRWKSLLHYLVGGLGIIIIIITIIIIIILLLLYGNISQLPLVSWNMTLGFLNMFFPYIGNNQPNWLSYFSEG